MIHVHIWNGYGPAESLESLRAFLGKLACVGSVTVGAAMPEGTNVLVVLVGGRTLTSGDFDALALTAVNRGIRVVGIWLPGNRAPTPVPLKEFGSATIPWDEAAASRVICEGAREWLNPIGDALAVPEFKRNKC